jgi:hypothetical protein
METFVPVVGTGEAPGRRSQKEGGLHLSLGYQTRDVAKENRILGRMKVTDQER